MVGWLSAADPSLESQFAPLVELVIFRFRVWSVICRAAAVAETDAAEMVRGARGVVLAMTNYLGWITHFLDDIVELSRGYHSFEGFESRIHVWVTDLGRFHLCRLTWVSRQIRQWRSDDVLWRQLEQPRHVAEHHLVQD